MKILFAASEAAPFVKTGGLADVAQGLPTYLAKNKDVDIRVIIPYYKSIKDKNDKNIKFLTSFGVNLGWRRLHVGIFEAVYKKVKYYFIDNEYYFNRDSCYGFYDDGERFAYFSKAILESLMHIDFIPDVIHLNDWQTALVPAFLKAHYGGMISFHQIKTLFTIHNIEYQGKVSNEFLGDVLGFGEEMRGVMSYEDCINFMKSAIVLADKVSTVSETYSYEIRYSFFSHGLSEILKQYEYKICGITNGIDTDLFNPNKDKNLIVNYKAGEIEKKEENKRFLQEKLG
ncbi:MAG: glycogen synthase, partial [Clostridiales bacterium]|nr:glycogen synthase [Clostridiales bacterium]